MGPCTSLLYYFSSFTKFPLWGSQIWSTYLLIEVTFWSIEDITEAMCIVRGSTLHAFFNIPFLQLLCGKIFYKIFALSKNTPRVCKKNQFWNSTTRNDSYIDYEQFYLGSSKFRKNVIELSCLERDRYLICIGFLLNGELTWSKKILITVDKRSGVIIFKAIENGFFRFEIFLINHNIINGP